jgi:hypothetical protein
VKGPKTTKTLNGMKLAHGILSGPVNRSQTNNNGQ